MTPDHDPDLPLGLRLLMLAGVAGGAGVAGAVVERVT